MGSDSRSQALFFPIDAGSERTAALRGHPQVSEFRGEFSPGVQAPDRYREGAGEYDGDCALASGSHVPEAVNVDVEYVRQIEPAVVPEDFSPADKAGLAYRDLARNSRSAGRGAA
jgi:hypothetical protein